jgi:anaerobic glycerol-3-phosphate dehydrogenase
LNAGVADIGTLRWTHGRAWFRSNVYLDSNLYVNQDIYVDTIKNLTADGLVLQSYNDINLYAGDKYILGYFDD